MAYLTYEEYVSFHGTADQSTFDKLEDQAEMAINNATRDYYRNNDLSTDINQNRVEDFKRAMKEQIDYYKFAGNVKSYETAQNEFKSVSIGRLSLTPNDSAIETLRNDLCREAYELLAKQGLLFRGV